MKPAIKTEKTKNIIFWAAVGLIILLIIAVIIIEITKPEPETPSQPAITQEPIVRYVTETETVYVDKIVPVEVEKKITTDILEEQLHDMGLLVTEEYFFKEVTTFESTKTYAWIINAKSKLIMGYEGTLQAGIDFTDVSASVNDDKKQIIVTLPKADITSCSLDFDSFEVYQEDVSRWNPITAEDYNGSLKELEEKATKRALERGILENAQENAETLITNFIGGLIDLSQYKLEYRTAQ